jgi:hypothetical protein
MPVYFLRIEGVNHGNIIDDTDDLSTRRGGGLTILNAPRQLKGDTQPGASVTLDPLIRNRLTIINTGASIGLFKFDAANDDEAEELAQKVREHFRLEKLEYADPENAGKTDRLPLRIGTFVVDVAPIARNEPEAEQQAEQLALAKNRWRQLQEPTLSLDGLWDQATEACFVDKTRPANSGKRLPKDRGEPPGDKRDVSISVFWRHQYGRAGKQKFYQLEWEALEGSATYPSYAFTSDFHEIAEHPDRDFCSINNKLAVFYIDGNRFGQKGRNAFRGKGAAGFKEWSDAVQKHHRGLLRDLLKIAAADPRWKIGSLIRLETLIWGGDEILFVVPAWKGWELATWFFSHEHKLHEQADQAVSYAGGLVFCHAKAPIKNVIALAKKIAEKAKDLRRSDDGHRLSYEVLESFDDITGDLDEHRGRWLPASVSVASLIFDPTKPFWEPLQQIAENTEFPLRQLYMLCKAWRTGDAIEPYERRLKRDKLHEPVTAFLNAFDNKPVAWLHLLQMLPYIPVSEKGGEP